MLVKKLGEGKKGNKRVCLITDAQSSIRESAQGTVEQQVDQIAGRMGEQGIKLDAVVVQIGNHFLTNSTALHENEGYLERFKMHTQGEVGFAKTATSMLGIIRNRTVSPTTLYRGDLELTPSMNVKVGIGTLQVIVIDVMKYQGFLSVASLSFVVFTMDQKIIRCSVILLHIGLYLHCNHSVVGSILVDANNQLQI